MKSIKINYKKQKTTKLQKKKQQKINKKRASIGEQNESKKEIKQNEGKHKRQNMKGDDTDIGHFLELASVNKIHVSGLNLHGIKNETSQAHTCDF